MKINKNKDETIEYEACERKAFAKLKYTHLLTVKWHTNLKWDADKYASETVVKRCKGEGFIIS